MDWISLREGSPAPTNSKEKFVDGTGITLSAWRVVSKQVTAYIVAIGEGSFHVTIGPILNANPHRRSGVPRHAGGRGLCGRCSANQRTNQGLPSDRESYQGRAFA